MALACDEFENNPFYRVLETKYPEKFEEAQRKLWVVCVPSSKSLKGIKITKDFISSHILKPSPFFKNHFVTTDVNTSDSFEIENGVIKSDKGYIKIVTEEMAYNNDFKQYKMLIIERPLTQLSKNEEGGSSAFTSRKLLLLSLNECTHFLKQFTECLEVLKELDKKLQLFNTAYIVLPRYLKDAAAKLQSILSWAVTEFLRSLTYRTENDYSKIEISAALENYILSHVHDKVFPVIKKFCQEDDTELTQQLQILHEAHITPDQLGVQESFCCLTPSAVVELASLNSRKSPAEKFHCLMTTLELLNRDIEKFLLETHYPVSNKDPPSLTSDDLIPLLVYVIIQARPQYFVSNLHYIQNFCWENSPIDKLSFGLVTFLAAKEFFKSNNFDFMKPSVRKIKKEISLEELMEVTIEMQNNKTLAEESKPTQSPTDYLLENVTKMIDASTQELRDLSEIKNSIRSYETRNLKIKSPENAGDFLSSLRQSSLGMSYGKLT